MTKSLRASATIAIFLRDFIPRLTRSTNRLAQALCRYTIHATSISMPRKRLGPRRVMRPTRFIVPLSICLGTNPA